MFDSGRIMYAGLFVLWVWRQLCPWRCFGVWLQYANYNILLYALLLFLLVHSITIFTMDAFTPEGKAVWGGLCFWMKPLVLAAPLTLVMTFALCLFQSVAHVGEIRRGSAPLKHDRAVQIIALPAVYGTMALSVTARVYRVMTREGPAVKGADPGAMLVPQSIFGDAAGTPESRAQLALSRSETCFLVGDLYEAWALYQFAKLTLETMALSLAKAESSERAEERWVAHGLAKGHAAVESLAWLGVLLFLMVCLVQAGWSIYMLTSVTGATFAEYEGQMATFTAAGVVASMAAIYNISVVESQFEDLLEGFRPLLKFITVKVIVSVAFFQQGAFAVLKTLHDTLPNVLHALVERLPVLGDIVAFTPLQFEIFYSTLIVFECALVAVMHYFAWDSREEWYKADSGAAVVDPAQQGNNVDDLEKRPLLPATKS